jgi:hypothetical protein
MKSVYEIIRPKKDTSVLPAMKYQIDPQLEYEILLWALDEDSIQNIFASLRSIENDPEIILSAINSMVSSNIIEIYQYTFETNSSEKLSKFPISMDYICANIYTNIVHNENTLNRIEEIGAGKTSILNG